jgi:hypothetical protein
VAKKCLGECGKVQVLLWVAQKIVPNSAFTHTDSHTNFSPCYTNNQDTLEDDDRGTLVHTI